MWLRVWRQLFLIVVSVHGEFVIIIWKLKYIWGICYNYMEIEVYMGNLLRQLKYGEFVMKIEIYLMGNLL